MSIVTVLSHLFIFILGGAFGLVSAALCFAARHSVGDEEGWGGGYGSATGSLTMNSDTEAKGKGSIDRSEKLRLAVAVVVTEVLPNGNLMIRGSQEILVNYEVRVLTIAGMVNPLDITGGNQIAYDRIAEARISYAGRGRLNDVQQPAWGQRIYDLVVPF